MELLFAVLGGAILGLIARYSLPGRDESGVVLLPAIGAATAGVVWVALTWAGLRYDAGIIWVLTLLLAGLISFAAARYLARSRKRSDQALFARLAGRTPAPTATRRGGTGR